jgi:hypothetical protein
MSVDFPVALGDEVEYNSITHKRKNTLETSEKDAKLHSKRVKKMQNYTQTS